MKKKIIDEIHDNLKDRTIIISSHRKKSLEKCDLIFSLDKLNEN